MILKPVLRKVLVDLGNILKNVHLIEDSFGVSKERIVAVVKEDAYGHGALVVSKVLAETGIGGFAFASVDEATKVADVVSSHGVRVFILGGICGDEEASICEELGFIPVISDLSDLRSLKGRRINYFIKFDTGMGRLGLLPGDVEKLAEAVRSLGIPPPSGIVSHLSSAGEDDLYTSMQVSLFEDVAGFLEAEFGSIEKQLANSSYLLSGGSPIFDSVRLGIALYGSAPIPSLKGKVELHEAMSFFSFIWQVRPLKKGARISYGGIHTLKRDSVLGVVPVGYAHGYSRLLTGKAHVLVKGMKAPVIGRITMDWIVVDLTDVADTGGVSRGDEVVLMGSMGDERISAWDIADWMGTIPYEVYCLFGGLNERNYVGP